MIQGAADLLIRALLDRQQYDDADGAAEAAGISPASWPLFGVAWPSGLRLAAHMAARDLSPGERILEVGCGLALASLVCHRRGIDITASDRHPLTADFLDQHARLNGLAPMRYRHGDWSGSEAPRPEGSDPGVDGRFDTIIGSDVLYERDDDGHLAGFIERHAKATAEVLIVDPDRGNRNPFSRRLADQGFALSSHPLREAVVDGVGYRGRLLRYVRVAALSGEPS